MKWNDLFHSHIYFIWSNLNQYFASLHCSFNTVQLWGIACISFLFWIQILQIWRVLHHLSFWTRIVHHQISKVCYSVLNVSLAFHLCLFKLAGNSHHVLFFVFRDKFHCCRFCILSIDIHCFQIQFETFWRLRTTGASIVATVPNFNLHFGRKLLPQAVNWLRRGILYRFHIQLYVFHLIYYFIYKTSSLKC